MKKTIFLLFTLLSSLVCFADEPPCWCAFEKKSANGKYVAVVNRPQADSLIDPWKSEWTLSVYEYVGKRKKLLWKVKYEQTVSHQLWLKIEGPTYNFVRASNDKLLLKIQTIDDKIHYIDISNGKRVTDT